MVSDIEITAARPIKVKAPLYRRLLLRFQVVGFIGLALLLWGAFLADAIWFNPSLPGFLFAIFLPLLAFVYPIGLFISFLTRWDWSHILKYYGEEMDAMVIKSTASPSGSQGGYQVDFVLELYPSDREPFRVEKTVQGVRQALLKRYQPGEIFQVKWHPAYPERAQLKAISYKIQLG